MKYSNPVHLWQELERVGLLTSKGQMIKCDAVRAMLRVANPLPMHA